MRRLLVTTSAFALLCSAIFFPANAQASLINDNLNIDGANSFVNSDPIVGQVGFVNNVGVLTQNNMGSLGISVTSDSKMMVTATHIPSDVGNPNQITINGLDWGGLGVLTGVMVSNDMTSGGNASAMLTGNAGEVVVTFNGAGSVEIMVTSQHVPEPSSLALLGVAGVGMIAGLRFRRKRRA